MLKILEWLITRYRHKTPGDMAHLHLPTHIPVGAAEGCDLLTVVSGRKIKRSSDRGPSLRQLLQGSG
ncbi:hypothetical protein PS718_01486 [Pseudomonas fluorescens]|uniref:Uncharacterized protein n=1 Tax=Pseudomonas fluorescens TaxID=294 RepID=A0A5E7BBD4_PSEFL|nr:hypothetical protein PS718_01486 [Pseudomonas fluorescens]